MLIAAHNYLLPYLLPPVHHLCVSALAEKGRTASSEQTVAYDPKSCPRDLTKDHRLFIADN